MIIRTHIFATLTALSLTIGPIVTPAMLTQPVARIYDTPSASAAGDAPISAAGLPVPPRRPGAEQAPQIAAALSASAVSSAWQPDLEELADLDAPAAPCGGGVVFNIASDITSDTTLTSGHVYLIDGYIQVDPGVTLTVEKGAVVKLGLWDYLDVYGTLDLSTGSGADPIFTSVHDDEMCDSNNNGSTTQPVAASNGWDALYLELGSNLIGSAVLRHSWGGLDIFNAGSGTLSPTIGGWVFDRNVTGLTLTISGAGSVNPSIQNNTFTANRDGLVVRTVDPALDTGAAQPTISTNTFNNQVRFPIFLGGTAYPVYSGNIFTNSGIRGIGLSGTWQQSGTLALVSGSNDVPLGNLPYVVYERWLGDTSPTRGGRVTVTCDCSPGYMTIKTGATVTVPNNTMFKLGGHLLAKPNDIPRWIPYYIDAQGAFILGTGVTFTSLWDDLGGDTNRDSATTTPLPGDWDAIYLGTTSSSVTNATVRYADTGLNVYASSISISPSISNSTFQYNKSGGVYVTALGSGQATSTISGNTFTGLEGQSYAGLGVLAVDSSSTSAPTVTGNTFTGGFTSTVYLETYNGLTGGTYSNNTMRNSVNGVELWLGGRLVGNRPESGSGDITGTFTGNTIENNAIGFRTYATYFIEGNTIYSHAQGSARPSLQNNVFTNNTTYPIELAGGGFPTYSGNTFQGSGRKAINMYGFWSDESGGAWPAVSGTSDTGGLPFVYRIDGVTRVHTGGGVSFAQGAILKMADNATFKTSAQLTFGGASSGSPTVITSWSDDSVRGDTNADGGSTSPSKGSWYGFFLSGPKPALTQYLDVRYGVFGLQYEEYYAPDPACPAVANSTFSNNVYGFVVLAWNSSAQNSCMTVRDSTFTGNTIGIGLSVFGWGDIISNISNNTLTNNTYGVATSQRDWTIPIGTTSWVQMTGNGLYRPNQTAAEGFVLTDPIGPAGGSLLPTLANNTVNGGSFPMYYGATTFPTLTGNVFSGMTHRAIRLGGVYRDTEQGFTLARVPLAAGSSQVLAYAMTNDPVPCTIPYWGGSAQCISPNWTIAPLSPVSLAAGTAVKIDDGLFIDVFGELYLQGTSVNPVVFTSYKDDSVNGDTDGASGTPARGDWLGIYLESSGIRADYAFENAVVKYATDGVAIYNDSVANNNIFPIVRNNTFLENTTALTLTPRRGGNIINRTENNGSTTPLISNNLFRNNDQHIVANVPAGAGHVNASLRNNCFLPTVTVGLDNKSTSNIVDASSNWWGAPTGPGAGVTVAGTVNTSSPLTSAPSFCTGQTYAVSGRAYLAGDTPDVPLPLASVVVAIDGGLSTSTNASGFFVINGVAGGTQTVRPFAPGYRFTPSSRTIEVVGAATGIEFEATAVSGQVFTISGTVVDEDNQPLSAVTVVAQDVANQGYGSSAASNTSGAFTLTSLPAGQYVVRVASISGYVPETRTVGPNQTGVVLKPGSYDFVYLPLLRK